MSGADLYEDLDYNVLRQAGGLPAEVENKKKIFATVKVGSGKFQVQGTVTLHKKRNEGSMLKNSVENRLDRFMPAYSVQEVAEYQMKHMEHWIRDAICNKLLEKEERKFVECFRSIVGGWIAAVERAGIGFSTTKLDPDDSFGNDDKEEVLHTFMGHFKLSEFPKFKETLEKLLDEPFHAEPIEHHHHDKTKSTAILTAAQQKKREKAANSNSTASHVLAGGGSDADDDLIDILELIWGELDHAKEVEDQVVQQKHKQIMGDTNVIFSCEVERAKEQPDPNDVRIRMSFRMSKSIKLTRWIRFFRRIFA
eukprot:TRINITY_DN15891_c0_g1_i1.p1 TRINITY_DN15891_c0_g1~~TRINITY_DN15891_c0_g1_i1.p1  ORF type:complete len:309 (+),score=82.51 TRINITY_DN15891_c0_g1_i1:101-1027(+)